MDDRRIFERIEAAFSIKLLNPYNGDESDGITFDISANGIGLTSNRLFEKGTPLEMWLSIPDQHSPLYCRGNVVWNETGKGISQQRLGVCLERAHLMGLARVLWMKRRNSSAG